MEYSMPFMCPCHKYIQYGDFSTCDSVTLPFYYSWEEPARGIIKQFRDQTEFIKHWIMKTRLQKNSSYSQALPTNVTHIIYISISS